LEAVVVGVWLAESSELASLLLLLVRNCRVVVLAPHNRLLLLLVVGERGQALLVRVLQRLALDGVHRLQVERVRAAAKARLLLLVEGVRLEIIIIIIIVFRRAALGLRDSVLAGNCLLLLRAAGGPRQQTLRAACGAGCRGGGRGGGRGRGA